MKSPILEEIEKVKSICSVAKKAQNLNDDLRLYKGYIDIVNEVTQKFTTLIGQYDVIKIILKAEDERLKACFEGYREGFKSIELNIRNDKVSNTSFIALKGLNTNFENVNNQIWTKYVNERLESSYKTLVVFQDFIGFSKFREIDNVYSTIKNSKPSEYILNIMSKFENQASEIIKGMNADDEIISFITKVSSNQATISDLNEKILTWIKQNNYTSKIKITM